MVQGGGKWPKRLSSMCKHMVEDRFCGRQWQKWMKVGRKRRGLISWHIRIFLCVPTSLCCFLFILLVCLEIYIELLMSIHYKAEGIDRVEQ